MNGIVRTRRMARQLRFGFSGAGDGLERSMKTTAARLLGSLAVAMLMPSAAATDFAESAHVDDWLRHPVRIAPMINDTEGGESLRQDS